MVKEKIPGIPNKFKTRIACKCLKGTKESIPEQSFTNIIKVGEICECFIGTSFQTDKKKLVSRVFIEKVDRVEG